MPGQEEYYLGWVIQPLNMQGTLFYVYERDDTSRQKGFIIRGNREEAYWFIDSKTSRG